MRRYFLQTTLYTLIAILGFSANAIICRWTLDNGFIDPVSFTSFRLGAGAVMLFIVMALSAGRQTNKNKIKTTTVPSQKGDWKTSIYLFIYALTFSYGYVAISTATGTLILAGVVQLTMIGYALRNGDKLHGAEWLGLILALIGLVYLMYPKLTSPSWWGLVMVIISAYTWASYSLNGRHSLNPITDTAYNFYRTLPMVLLLIAVTLAFTDVINLTPIGMAMAILSGGVTSGLGYIIWYKALPRLSSSLASACQLLVPLFAAFGAHWLIDEAITLHFLIAAAMMLGGLALVLIGRNQHRKKARLSNTV
ncbi:MAG: DMT family transporter [Pseudomonadota bacterium]|nr:DMT family transporter [Pseudomonadota bacterium]